MANPFLSSIESTTMDYTDGHIEIRATDGLVFRFQKPDWPASLGPAAKDFARAVFHPADSLLTLVTPSGVSLEIETLEGDDAGQQINGRAVVYLDQNIWVQIAQAVHSPGKVPKTELEPTRRLIELVTDRRLILPLSAGHAIEIEPLGGKWRTELALEMVRLSRGWVMFDPLRVRRNELDDLIRTLDVESNSARANPVFTLDTRTFFAEEAEPYRPTGTDLPPEAVFLIQALSGVQSLLATLLEDSSTPRGGIAESTQWASAHEALAGSLAADPKARFRLRSITLLAFLSDLGDDLLRALQEHSVTPPRFQEWVDARADGEIARLPYLGRMREVVHRRLANSQTAWGVNDLIDVPFLSCAAGYADYVVCEKHLAHHLKGVGHNLSGGAKVYSRCAPLIEDLERGRPQAH